MITSYSLQADENDVHSPELDIVRASYMASKGILKESVSLIDKVSILCAACSCAHALFVSHMYADTPKAKAQSEETDLGVQRGASFYLTVRSTTENIIKSYPGIDV